MAHKIPISIVIPMYNEADNVAPFLTEIHQSLKEAGLTIEIIVINDGSTDKTHEQLNLLSNTIPGLCIINHAYNSGQSAAILTGARAAKHPWIITLDGDAQNDPNDIPLLLEQLKNNSDHLVLIVGNRTNRCDSRIRKLSSRIANSIRQRLLHDDCMDTGCSLKLFSRDVFLQLPHFNHMHRFLPALIKRAGGRVINVPVNHRPRTRGTSKYGVTNRLWVGIVDLFGVKWLMNRTLSSSPIPSSSCTHGDPES